jgi:formamidopyrimidine-DNA glycosylase
MPELPEVETTRRIVERTLTGRTVSAVLVRLPKLLRDSPIPTLEPLVGQTVLGARRRAKVLVIEFTASLSLMIHFKLAGQLAVHLPDGFRDHAGHPTPDPAGSYPHKATHIEFHFTDGAICYFSDVRQFGWLRLLPADDVQAALDAFHFGPEAFGETRMSTAELAARLARRGIPVKLALLDQQVIAGIGNIYVDEALHRAKIHPVTPARDLSIGQVETLNQAIAWALEIGIEQGGAKIRHNKAYPIDGFPEVHARVGEACPICGTTIEKIRVGARGTYFCPTCQPPPVIANRAS